MKTKTLIAYLVLVNAIFAFSRPTATLNVPVRSVAPVYGPPEPAPVVTVTSTQPSTTSTVVVVTTNNAVTTNNSASVVAVTVITTPIVPIPVPVVTVPIIPPTIPVTSTPVIPVVTPAIPVVTVPVPIIAPVAPAPVILVTPSVPVTTPPVITLNNATSTLNVAPIVTTNNIAPIVTLNAIPIVTTNNIAPIVTLNTTPIVTTNNIAPIVTLNTTPIVTTNNAIITLNTTPIVTTNNIAITTTNNAIITLNTTPIVITSNIAPIVITSNIAPIVTLNTTPIVTTNNIAITTTNNVTPITTTNNIAVITTNNVNAPITVIAVKISNIRSTVVISQQYTLVVEVDYSNGKVAFNPPDLVITQDSNHFTQNGATFIGAKSGYATITATDKNMSVSETVYVDPIEIVSNIDSFLTTPAQESRIIVPVVIINYMPTNDGINLDTMRAFTGYNPMTLLQVKNRANDIQKLTKFGIEEGSKFRGFSNANAKPEVGMQVIEYVNVYELTTMMVPNQVITPTTDPIIDVRPIFQRLGMQNLVNINNVKEVWLNFYPISSEYQVVQQYNIPQSQWINFAESYMSSPTTGNISNSDRSNDVLPVYNSTYVVYGYNLGRTYAENIHNRGHQIEAQLGYMDTSSQLYSGVGLFWNQFVGIPQTGGMPTGRVGDTHFPPNGTADYDYSNTSYINTDICNWEPLGGKQQSINCTLWMNPKLSYPLQSTWSNDYMDSDAQWKWIVCFFQSIPGYNNNIPFHGSVLTDWWDIFYNWDNANKNKELLWK